MTDIVLDLDLCARVLKHLLQPTWWAHRAVSAAQRAHITELIKNSEMQHMGEIVVIFEGPLPLRYLVHAELKSRALDLFSDHRVWDTEGNCGILVYIQLIDRKIELLADRGIFARVSTEDWQIITENMGVCFAAGEWLAGVETALQQLTILLAQHFPAAHPKTTNQLNDETIFI